LNYAARQSQCFVNAWLIAPCPRRIGEYRESLKKYPNPPAPSLTEFRNRGDRQGPRPMVRVWRRAGLGLPVRPTPYVCAAKV